MVIIVPLIVLVLLILFKAVRTKRIAFEQIPKNVQKELMNGYSNVSDATHVYESRYGKREVKNEIHFGRQGDAKKYREVVYSDLYFTVRKKLLPSLKFNPSFNDIIIGVLALFGIAIVVAFVWWIMFP
jgi:predicted Holliday junction resolvase-like endonuclease